MQRATGTTGYVRVLIYKLKASKYCAVDFIFGVNGAPSISNVRNRKQKVLASVVCIELSTLIRAELKNKLNCRKCERS
jgi:hypothetical protein